MPLIRGDERKGLSRLRSGVGILFGLMLVCSTGSPARQSNGYGPEVRSFLEYISHEEVELNFQVTHNEISRKEFARSKNRLEVQKQAVLTRVKRTGQDIVPEYSVMAADELGDILSNGLEDLKGHKPGDDINAKWRYVGFAILGEKFYIMERIAGK
jgi:hypothetical protein